MVASDLAILSEPRPRIACADEAQFRRCHLRLVGHHLVRPARLCADLDHEVRLLQARDGRRRR